MRSRFFMHNVLNPPKFFEILRPAYERTRFKLSSSTTMPEKMIDRIYKAKKFKTFKVLPMAI